LKNIKLVLVSQHNHLGTANGHWNHERFKGLILCKVAIYILEPIQENLQIHSSTGNDINTRIDLQAVQITADSW
jgi:hypothetical protein